MKSARIHVPQRVMDDANYEALFEVAGATNTMYGLSFYFLIAVLTLVCVAKF